jgi:DNA-binding GntR family transcriptional regulator
MTQPDQADRPTDDLLPRGDDGTLQEWVFRRLRHDIMTGRFEPGLAVTIRGLAAQLKVSAMPVREALRRLVAERALVLLDNRRVRVPEMTVERFEDLLAARILLEGEAAERALPYLNDTVVAELAVCDARLDAARNAGDIEGWVVANFAFHSALYTARPNSVLMPLIESLWLQIGPFMRSALGSVEGRYSVDRHGEAMAAIAAQDRRALRMAIEADIRDGIGHIGLIKMREEAPMASNRRRRLQRSP